MLHAFMYISCADVHIVLICRINQCDADPYMMQKKLSLSVACAARHRQRAACRQQYLHVSRPQFFTALVRFLHAEHGSHSMDDPLARHLIGPIAQMMMTLLDLQIVPISAASPQ